MGKRWKILGVAGIFALVVGAESSNKPKIGALPDKPPEPPDNPTTPEKVELGKLLYFDPRLSGDGSVSCATCHDPNHGWAKKRVMSPAYPENKHFRHSPTVLNVAYNMLMFWDGRAKSLEEQAEKPILSPFEMNMNYDLLEERLKAIPGYVERFKKAFPGEKDPVNIKNVAKAIAAFERTIVCNDSPFDLYMKGDKNAMTPEQVKGMKLFVGKAGCVQCHNGVNFTDDKFHVTGVPKHKLESNALVAATRNFVLREAGFKNPESIDRDLGRYFLTKKEEDKGSFKTPTLRNVSLTPPYMHNGVFKNLDEVIEFYDKGGGNVPNKSKLLKPLNLSDEEKANLRAFLEALTCKNVPVVEEPELPEYKN